MAPEALNNVSESQDPETLSSFSEYNGDAGEDCLAAETTPEEKQHGSTILGAIFNFTNSIVGAGCIGLGGAIAISGGGISIIFLIFFAFLTKFSLDLVIRLSIETEGAHGSYEDLAQVGLGVFGRLVVLGCKFVYSFGCLVAYVIVVKDNFGSAVCSLVFGKEAASDISGHALEWLHALLKEDVWTTWFLSLVVILPLCFLRDMTPLASFSVVGVASIVSIVAIIVYLFFAHPEIRQPGGSTYENWIEIRPGVWER
jgi:sodium-coupled neutral amino acid transporter 11